jgi:hypothetical protein
VIVGLDQFGRLYFFTVFGILEIVIMFVFHVQVEGWIAQVLLGAEAFVPWQVFVKFGLGPPPLLVVLMLLP